MGKPLIREGSELVLLLEHRLGDPIQIRVERSEAGLLWFAGPPPDGLEPGDVIVLECPVPEDARYHAAAEVEAASPDRFAIQRPAEWNRLQERAYVRISTHAIDVYVARSSDEADRLQMLDLSAGGVAFEANQQLEVGESITCHFELPDEARFALPAHVVRVGPSRPDSKWRRICAEFEDLDEENTSSLLRWVFREQIRRHRRKLRRRR